MEKFKKIIKKIFIIITSPIWFFWKLLFVRKPEKKFKNMSAGVKTFRIVRSFVTKPLKFALFLCIIGLEILIVYKVRYSFITYPFTKSSVEHYYVDKNDSFGTAFDYIDTWNLNEKNKMYVILDSDASKLLFEYAKEESINNLLNKFNEEETFRENVKYVTTNMNSILSKLLRDVSNEEINDSDLQFLKPIIQVGSYTSDYAATLNVLGSIGNLVVKEYNVPKNSLELSEEEVDELFNALVTYNKGKSLEEAFSN